MTKFVTQLLSADHDDVPHTDFSKYTGHTILTVSMASVSVRTLSDRHFTKKTHLYRDAKLIIPRRHCPSLVEANSSNV